MNKLFNKRLSGFSNFGFSTIVFSFAMICVITFSVLSLTTANADYRLTQKVADKNTAYYLAEEKAYSHIEEVESALQEAFLTAENQTAYYESLETVFADLKGSFQQEENLFIYRFQETISDTQTLDVCLELTYPISADDTLLKIIEYKSVHTQSIPEDDILDLID